MTLHRPHLRELEILQALIAARKTTAAASRLGISQPAVSKAIARLEKRMGRKLFERVGRQLVPTPRALALSEEAEGIFAALDGLLSPSGPRETTKVIRIAGPPTLMHLFLPRLIAGFVRSEPDVSVQIEIGKTPDVIAAVADGLADIGISDTPPASVAVHAEAIQRTRAHVLLPQSHRLASAKSLTVADLADEPLIALARRFPARGRLDHLFHDAGLTMRTAAETTTAACAYELVREGLGIAVLNPFPLLLQKRTGLVFVPFEPEIIIETLVFTPALGPQSSLVRRFVDFLKASQSADILGQPEAHQQ